jgi:acetyltransferase-like isoleucine patch superfamily enzyme
VLTQPKMAIGMPMAARTRLGGSIARIGDITLFGPAVQIYTATHSMNGELRRKQEFAKPIEIGSDVWVGGGAVIALE